ncbi:hypothetical protein H9M94_02910 [Mycoplasma sp. Pen4]|uniref:hypothetical protein n=1 Tax=Mycoplasma sp. Pen4 TaxID=640330 RepID=UPI001654734B|nr:hypothetical protein [Mycoplasma sp. Pen4]QNM93537.1 hypothetical protein H9M94_02910 [Mycoplasma sp. Pen4]
MKLELINIITTPISIVSTNLNDNTNNINNEEFKKFILSSDDNTKKIFLSMINTYLSLSDKTLSQITEIDFKNTEEKERFIKTIKEKVFYDEVKQSLKTPLYSSRFLYQSDIERLSDFQEMLLHILNIFNEKYVIANDNMKKFLDDYIYAKNPILFDAIKLGDTSLTFWRALGLKILPNTAKALNLASTAINIYEIIKMYDEIKKYKENSKNSFAAYKILYETQKYIIDVQNKIFEIIINNEKSKLNQEFQEKHVSLIIELRNISKNYLNFLKMQKEFITPEQITAVKEITEQLNDILKKNTYIYFNYVHY